VTFAEAPGRWPEHEKADRLILCAGLAAITLDLTETEVYGTTTGYLKAAAEAIALGGAAGEGAVNELMGSIAGRRDGASPQPVEIELLRSALGATPKLRGSRRGPGTLLS
jgi:hypothetical protein